MGLAVTQFYLCGTVTTMEAVGRSKSPYQTVSGQVVTYFLPQDTRTFAMDNPDPV